jgi:hypothetical protein
MTNHNAFGHICDICRPHRATNSILSGADLGRRNFFKLAGAGVTGYFLTPLIASPTQAQQVVTPKLSGKARNCIFILLTGAPSHTDTFDLKVGSWTPADFNPTSYSGVMFPQGLMPKLAERLNRLAIVRSLRAPALVHPLQQSWAQIARSPSSALGKVAPNMGSVVALEFEGQRQPQQKLPVFTSLNTGGNVVGAGYFNGLYSPFDIAASPNGLGSLSNADGQARFDARYSALQALDASLRTSSPLGDDVTTMGSFYDRARGMMYDPTVDAVFKFTTDDQARYGGVNGFANSCVVARNLIVANQGTRYIQINFGNWDHHDDIYDKADPTRLHGQTAILDNGLSALMDDLANRSGINGGTLLDETLIVVMGEFGRTVGNITGQNGRDHYFQHFAVLAGGGVAGGKVIGETTPDGGATKEPGWSQNRPAQYEDIAATIYSALGIDYTKTLRDDPFGRGFDYVPFASEGAWYPIMEVFEKAVTPAPRTEMTPRSPETSPRSRGRSSDRRAGS